MTTNERPAPRSGHLAGFYGRNLEFDLAAHDFFRADTLDWTGVDAAQTRTELMARQRLLRLTGDEEAAERLAELGIASAHHVLTYSEPRFVAVFRDRFGGDDERLREIHRRATQVKLRAQHLWANVRGTAFSAGYRGSRFASDTSELADYFKQIPSYQDFFGSLDYASCRECRSITGPAAFFVDLMRITDEYVTNATRKTAAGTVAVDAGATAITGSATKFTTDLKPGFVVAVQNQTRTVTDVADDAHATVDAAWTAGASGAPLTVNSVSNGIPPGYTLDERRPDLAKIPLTCENATSSVKYLQLVNDILESRLEAELGTHDVYRYLANAAYPFDVPFNLPLTRLRTYLGSLGSSLAQVYAGTRRTPASDPHAVLPAAADVTRETLLLSVEQHAVVTTPRAFAQGLAPFFGLPGKSLLPFQAGGYARVTKGSRTVTGGSGWRSEVAVGDEVGVGAQRRTVQQVISDTELTVAPPWQADGGGPLMVLPKSNLSFAVQMIKRTTLDWAELNALIFGGLTDAERSAGLALRLFINNGGGPIGLSVDNSNPDYPLRMVTGLNFRNLDRLNRFVRLSQASGIDFADLDWTLSAAGATELDDTALAAVAAAADLSRSAGAPFDEALGLFSDLKTTGVTDPAAPQDLFDRVFNSPAILGLPPGVRPPFTAAGHVSVSAGAPAIAGVGTSFNRQVKSGYRVRVGDQVRTVVGIDSDVALRVDAPFDHTLSATTLVVAPARGLGETIVPLYHPAYAKNPLYTDPVLNWTVVGADSEPGVRERLLAALAVNDDDLTAIGDHVLCVLGRKDGVVPLDVPNLSLLWSYARLATLAQLPVRDLLRLLGLAGLNRCTSAGQVRQVLDLAAWLRGTGLTTSELAYVLAGTENDYQPAYNAERLTPFLVSLWAMAPSWLLSPASFTFETISAEVSAAYLAKLVTAKKVNDNGVVLDSAPDFTGIAFLDPLHASSFVTADIGTAQSAAAFAALKSHAVLTANGQLSAAFTDSTELSYLFENDQDQKLKIEEVRQVLLGVKSRIDYVVKTLATFATTQRANVVGQVANLLGTTPAIVEQVEPYAAQSAQLPLWIAAILVPPEPPLPPDSLEPLEPPRSKLATFMEVTARVVTAAGLLGLAPRDLAAIRAHPNLFNVTDLTAPSLGDVRSLETYRRLVTAFGDESGALIAYLEAEPGRGKTGKLAALAGWRPDQIQLLIGTYWHDDAGYSTVLGVRALKDYFDLAARLGVDATELLALAKVSRTGPLSDAAWDAYNAAARAWLEVLSAGFRREQWNEAYAPIIDLLNERRRDILVGSLLHRFESSHPEIATVSDLYDYLLVDVETGGCASTSPIKLAIGSVQLYLQRCRLHLEPGIETVPVPATWWQWLMSYRVWEANRKVFLYPENYLEPELRKDRSAAFATLQQDLISNDVDAASTYDAFVRYFEEFSALASVNYVDSFLAMAPDPATGIPVRTLFMIGRTAVEPYTYYHRTLVEPGLWSEWQKIDVAANAASVTPFYMNNRLFLFWIEQHEAAASTMANGTTTDSIDTRVDLRLSYLNPAGRWAAPQTLTEVVAAYLPVKYQTKQVDPNLFDLAEVQWKRVLPFLVRGQNDGPDSLLLTFGQYYPIPGSGESAPPKPDQSVTNRDARALADLVYDSVSRALDGAKYGLKGYTFVNHGWYLDAFLNMRLANVNVLPYTEILRNPPQPYMPKVAGAASQLTVYQVPNSFLVPYWSQGPAPQPTNPLSLLYNLLPAADVVPVGNQPFWFRFDSGDEQFMVRSQEPGIGPLSEVLEVDSNRWGENLISLAYTKTPSHFPSITWRFDRLSTGALTRLRRRLQIGGVSALLSVDAQLPPAAPSYPFSRFYERGQQSKNVVPPAIADGDDIDYAGPYGLYFWETFYFAPLLIANQLRASQRFEEAMRWYEYIFDPTVAPSPGDPAGATLARYWRFVHLRGIGVPTLREILTSAAQIKRYNDHPFDPNAIAQLRPSAYQKTAVMRYLDNLLAWADTLFAQDTWESINQASLVLTLAGDLLGPRPVDLGELQPPESATFAGIKAKYGEAIPQFWIEMENALPPTTGEALPTDNRYIPFNDLDTYFCVGENAELMGYWDRIDDRLYKIRNCMNLSGQTRQLALYEPPLDVRALVRAAAAGHQPVGVGPVRDAVAPPYRFRTVLRLAKELTDQLVRFGAALLSALERRDGEALAVLQQGQAVALLEMSSQVREQQIKALTGTVAALQSTQRSAQDRARYFDRLIEAGWSQAEALNIASLVLSNVFSTVGSIVRGLSAVAYALPNVGSPFAMTYGGQQLGATLAGAANVQDAYASIASMVSAASQTIAGYERREQEWQLQLMTANYDDTIAGAQLTAAQAELAAATRDLAVHLASIEQARDYESALKSKFTSQELYEWMIGRLSAVYSQAYLLALDVATGAELAYQYELSRGETFIRFDYWDGARKGLLAGEQLALSLGQLEKAYTDNNVRTLAIERTVSLLSLDPLALLALQRDGECEFELSEALFDSDYPGHYDRKIVSVAVTIPAVVGPYQNVKGTLTQVGNQVVLVNDDLSAVALLLGLRPASTPSSRALRSNWRPQQRIALSTGIEDSGTFPGAPDDDRYLPFEGTGAVSRWRLSVPKHSNTFDYSSVSDIILKVRYTARDGGKAFRDDVLGLLGQLTWRVQRAVSTAVEFPLHWHAFLTPAADATEQRLTFTFPAGSARYDVASARLTAVNAQLALGPAGTVDTKFPVTLEIGPGGSSSVPLSFGRGATDTGKSGLTITGFLGTPWSFVVKKADIPTGLADPETGFLDPRRLTNVSLVATYSAERMPT